MRKPIGIMPRSGLYLDHWNCSDEQAHRFAEVFRQTWKRLPMWARRPMLKDWRNWRDYFISLCADEKTREEIAAIPVPALSIDCFLRGGTDDALAAYYGHYGRAIQFWKPAVEMMPDDVLSTLIAHELAHAYLHATGRAPSKQPGYVPLPKEDEWLDDEEAMVRETMNEWDFEDSAIDEWLHEHRARMMAAHEFEMQELKQAA